MLLHNIRTVYYTFIYYENQYKIICYGLIYIVITIGIASDIYTI